MTSSGAEILAQVREELKRGFALQPGKRADYADDLLDGCRLLTREESAQLWQLIEDYMPDGFRDDDGVWHGAGDSVVGTEKVKALALLQPGEER